MWKAPDNSGAFLFEFTGGTPVPPLMQISPRVFGRARKLRRDGLEELFAEVYPAVVRIARGLSGREDVAEGVVRFVMTRSVVMIPKWRDETVAERWFLHHTVLTVRRAAGYAPTAIGDVLVDSPDPAYVAFLRALRGLPVQQREAIVLHFGEHLNSRYMSVAMDCSTDAAQAHLEAATGTLRAVTGGEFEAMISRLSNVYVGLGPKAADLMPAVRRWVKRGLRPHRLRRTVLAAIGVVVIVGMLWVAWKWERG
jgi:DNA-directed RNA polymerase specialized sigma24 family protein